MSDSEPESGTSAYQKLLGDLPGTGPGTKGGEMLRRYWHPVCLSANLKDVSIAARMLCEDLVVFRDGKGRPGLLGHSLFPSACVIGVWSSERRRADVLLSWVAIRFSGSLHRPAFGAVRQ